MTGVGPFRLGRLKAPQAGRELAPTGGYQELRAWVGKAGDQIASEGDAIWQQQAGMPGRVAGCVHYGRIESEAF